MVPIIGPLPVKGGADTKSLLDATTASAAATVNGSAVNLPRPRNGIVFELDVTAAASAVDDKLDVKVQTTLDGTNWIDVCYFTQLLGNGGAKHYVAAIIAAAVAMFENGTALTAGNVRAIFGDQFRVVYTITAGAGTHTFTFNVNACVF